MDPIIYHYGERFQKPVVTVCLLKKGKQFARGLTMCSKLDEPNSNSGLNKAKGRAEKAIVNKKPDLPINRNEAIRLLFESGAPPFRFKSEFPAKLTHEEMGMVG